MSEQQIDRLFATLDRIAGALERLEKPTPRFDDQTAQILDAVRNRYEERLRGVA